VVKQGSPQILSGKMDFDHDEDFTGIKRLIREDTNAIVDEIPMEPGDFQSELSLEEKISQVNEDKKQTKKEKRKSDKETQTA